MSAVPRATVVTFAVLTACSAPPVSGRDANLVDRDAELVEGGLPPNDGGRFDGSVDGAAIDAGVPACPGTCDPRAAATGCPGATRCVLVDRATSCVSDDAGPAPDAGAHCTGELDCPAGQACFRALDGSGACAPVCCPGDDTSCGGNLRCSADGVLVSGVSTDWGRCAPHTPCEILAVTSACAPREGCYVVYPRGVSDPWAECLLAGAAAAGEPCAAQNDCAPGFFCTGLSTSACVRICVLGDTCPSGEGTCTAQAYSPPGTGVCIR